MQRGVFRLCWGATMRVSRESVLLLEVYGTSDTDDIGRQVYRQFLRNELARFSHCRTRQCMPPRKLR